MISTQFDNLIRVLIFVRVWEISYRRDSLRLAQNESIFEDFKLTIKQTQPKNLSWKVVMITTQSCMNKTILWNLQAGKLYGFRTKVT